MSAWTRRWRRSLWRCVVCRLVRRRVADNRTRLLQYCNKKRVPLEVMRFLLDGQRLKMSEQPWEAGIETVCFWTLQLSFVLCAETRLTLSRLLSRATRWMR